MKKSMKGKMLTILVSMTMVFTMLSMNTGMVFADEPDYDIGNCQVTFDQSYLVEDDDPSTPYVEQFYDVPEGTVLEPTVANGDTVLSSGCFKALYSEVHYNEDKGEYNLIDENDWTEVFPTKQGVYFCKCFFRIVLHCLLQLVNGIIIKLNKRHINTSFVDDT
jgi:hypothetical protein